MSPIGSVANRNGVKALRFGERIVRAKLTFLVLIFNHPKIRPVDFLPRRPQLKFQPGYFLPCRLHVSRTHIVTIVIVMIVIKDFTKE